MRILRYFKGHGLATLLVFCLLVVQAFCDLSLPNYTSRIVDTGIQQYGIADAAPTVMTVRTHDLIAMMLPEGDEALFDAGYALAPDGTYALTKEGEASHASLNEVLTVPLAVIGLAGQAAPEGQALGLDLDAALAAWQAGALPKAQVTAMLDQMVTAMGASSALLGQQAIAAARAEYEAAGLDVAQMQTSYLLRTGAAMLGITALCALAMMGVCFLSARTGASIGRDLRERLFARVLSFSDAEVERFSAASLITRGTNDIQLIQMVCVMAQRMVLYAPILAVGGIIMVARTNISMGWVIVLAVIAVLMVSAVLFGLAGPKFKLMQTLIDRVNLVSREILTGLPVIRAFGRERHEEARFEDANEALMRTQLFTNRVMAFMGPAMMLVMNVTSVAIVWVGAHYVDLGTIQTGDLIAFITYTMIVVSSFLIIGMIAILLPRALVAAGRIDEVLACEPSVVAPTPEDARDAELLDAPGARITFEHVSFAYEGAARDVLADVSFEARPGKVTAIIGPTGSGKSTIVKLLMRFYDPREGRVLIDGVDIRELSDDALRAAVSYAPQKAFLFSGTIGSTVAFSNREMPEERRRLAVEVAQAAEFVDARPEGMDAEIAQGGSNVSGGQRQRLSIARALAADARAYVFDDSFSALDYKTDAALRADLNTRLAGRTVVIVAQRIATIMGAHSIVVLDEGRVVGQGTHAELLESCEEYRRIAESQLKADELLRGGEAR